MWDNKYIKVTQEFVDAITGVKIGCNIIEPVQTVDGSWVVPYCVTELDEFSEYFTTHGISKTSRKCFLIPDNFPTDNNFNPKTPNFMPLVRAQQFGIKKQLEVDLQPEVDAEGVSKNKKAVVAMTYDTPNEQVFIDLIVHLLDEQGQSTEVRPVVRRVAGMDSIVDAETGEFLGAAADIVDPVTGDIINPDFQDRNIMYEFEYYRLAASTTPVVIDQMLANQALLANQAGLI